MPKTTQVGGYLRSAGGNAATACNGSRRRDR
jgi:hypothetical protein